MLLGMFDPVFVKTNIKNVILVFSKNCFHSLDLIFVVFY